MKKYFSLVLIILFFSCENNTGRIDQTSPSAETKVASQTGLVIRKGLTDTITCMRDSSFFYACYIPENFDTAKVYPLMVFCDPHAKGFLPVKKYKMLAEKYGFIFAGSYNSKNGQSQELGMQAIDMIVNDLKTKSRIDSKRLYTCGFSGGARVAAAKALLHGGIAGVIGCGAGFPAMDKFPSNRFRYISIVGNEDMNFKELYQLDKDLEQIKFPRQLLVFDGKHEWCSVEVMDEALMLQQLYAMQDGLTSVNDSFVKSSFDFFKTKIDVSMKNAKYQAFIECAKLMKAFDHLHDISEQKTLFADLRKSTAVRNSALELEDFIKAEQGLCDGYLNSMATKDLAWWNDQVAKMRSDIKKRPLNEAKTLKRVLNYLSLAAYMNTSHFIDLKQYEEAYAYLKIYELVDPENPDVYFLGAKLSVLQNKENDAFSYLRKAANNNYSDVAALLSEPAFRFLSKKNEFEELRKTIEGNSKEE